MKNKAINVLINMGMSANLLGFKYIRDTICLLDEALWSNANITELYKQVARMHGTTASRVERAIRHAFKTVIETGDQAFVDKYLSRTNTTNGNLLHTLYLRLSLEE